MAKFITHRNENYTVLSNFHFKDTRLSLKAKGLLSLMFSLPPDWKYSVMGLASLSSDGKDSVLNGIKELEKYKYLIRRKAIKENGQFEGYDYHLYEKPQAEEPTTEEPSAENPSTEKPILYKEFNNQLFINKVSNNNVLKNNTPFPPIGEEVFAIVKQWNSKDIIIHDIDKWLTDKRNNLILKAIKEYGLKEVLCAIDNYATALKDEKYTLFSYTWNLEQFLKQSNALPHFLNDGVKWLNYCNWKNKTQKSVSDPFKALYDSCKAEEERF